MEPQLYSIIHVASAFLLVGFTFQAFAAPTPGKRKAILMLSGIMSLLMLVAGVGLLHKLELGFPVWVIIKIGAWLLLSALAGIAFRKPGGAGTLTVLSIVLVLVALWAVYDYRYWPDA